MGLPSSGVMKASMIRAELKESGTWSINSPSSRKLAKVPSGVIKFSDFYGKSSQEETLLNGVFMGGAGFYAGFIVDKIHNPGTSITPEFISINNREIKVNYIYGHADETSNNLDIEFDCSDISLFRNKKLLVDLFSEESKTRINCTIYSFYVYGGKIQGSATIQDVYLPSVPEFTKERLFKMSVNIAVQEAKTL